jgi:diketogulonate reductase-like aldo/keto reductase
MNNSPILKLNNGVDMPALGLGVYKSSLDETAGVVKTAIDRGYRLIDTAAAYGNEAEVGRGIVQSGIDRSELFVITKLWISDFGYDQALHAFDRSMRKLGLEQLDLYLLHWPVPSEFERTLAAWKAAERLLAEGRTRAIGVSNFTPAHLDRLIARSELIPAVNQVELNPLFVQKALAEKHRALGIVTQAWSPIGGVNRYAAPKDQTPRDPLRHPVITTLAAKYGKTAAQIVLRWHLDHGYSAIPKSVQPGRIKENIDIVDFALAPEEIAAIDALDSGVRGGFDPEVVDSGLFNFEIAD